MNLEIGREVQELYQVLLPDLKNIYNDYIFLEMNDDKFELLVKKIIIELKNNCDKNIVYSDYIKNEFKMCLNSIIKKYLNDDITAFNLISNYINLNFSKIYDCNKAILSLKQINSFFELYKFSPSQEFLIRLIRENDIFCSLLNLVVEDIKVHNNIDIYDCIYPFVEFYCTFNDIVLESNLFLDSYINDTYNNNSLCPYLLEIGRYKILTREEEIEFMKKIKDGDLNARDLFIKHNLKLVIDIANRYNYRNKTLDFFDLIQEGNIGLMKAVSTFDIDKGYKFSTYATHVINDYIIKAMKEKGRTIKIPRDDIKRITLYRKIKDDFLEQYGRYPTKEEVSDIMNISEEMATRISMFEYDTVSLNNLCEDNEHEYLDFISDKNNPVEEFIEEKEKCEFIRKVLYNSGLTEKEISFVKLYFGIDCQPMSFLKIAKKYSISAGRVAQIMKNILKKMRNLKSLNIYYNGDYEISNKEYVFDNILLFLNKSRFNLLDEFDNQCYLIQLLLKSNFAKKEIDFFLLHYGCKLSINEIADEYKNKFTSQSGKDSLRVLRNISVIVNNKIKKSRYYNEIVEYIKDYEKIIKEFNELKNIKVK